MHIDTGIQPLFHVIVAKMSGNYKGNSSYFLILDSFLHHYFHLKRPLNIQELISWQNHDFFIKETNNKLLQVCEQENKTGIQMKRKHKEQED